MSAAYRRALQAIAAIRARLADQQLQEADRAALLVEFDEVLATLQARDHNSTTITLARRVAKLDRDLAGRPTRERNAVIRQRLGISKSRLYELRDVAANSPEISGLLSRLIQS